LSGIGGVKRPGIVHRLDKDTSGVMVIAKTDRAHVHLSEQFSSRQIEREYRAVVWGRFRKSYGRIESNLRRSPKNRLRMIVSKTGKRAATTYEVIEEFPLFSLIKLVLETGRTHQIRVHMASINHPIFGDATYGGRSKRLGGMSKKKIAYAVSLLKQFNRPCLHALTLGFVHPHTLEKKRFESPLPDDMVSLLNILRNHANHAQIGNL
jgi:23S rRNA pseudouridine1911/1915/1917 synthase